MGGKWHKTHQVDEDEVAEALLDVGHVAAEGHVRHLVPCGLKGDSGSGRERERERERES